MDISLMLKMKGDLQHNGSIINGESWIGYMKEGKSATLDGWGFSNRDDSEGQDFYQGSRKSSFFSVFCHS